MVTLGDALRFLPGILLDHVAVPLFVLCCAFGLLSLSQRKILQRRIMALVGESATEVPVSVRISAHGIDYEEPHIPTRIGWLGIKSISETPDHYFLAVNALRAFVIPKRDLSADQQRIVSEWFKSHGPTDTTA